MTARLECVGLTGGRGTMAAFRAVDLAVEPGKVLALLGPNGAGKTTLLLTVAGFLEAHEGSVAVDGVKLRNGRPAVANKAGLVLVPDTRSLFATLTVEEHLRVAAGRAGPDPREILEVFPALEKRWRLRAASLSGGEQQMLAVARALIQQPKVLLVDELSMGLAPRVVESLFDAIRSIATDRGCAIVLVEQHVSLALEVAHEAMVLNHGGIALREAAAALRGRADVIEQAYFGVTDDAVRS